VDLGVLVGDVQDFTQPGDDLERELPGREAVLEHGLEVQPDRWALTRVHPAVFAGGSDVVKLAHVDLPNPVVTQAHRVRPGPEEQGA
jgi:hypothetical protein